VSSLNTPACVVLFFLYQSVELCWQAALPYLCDGNILWRNAAKPAATSSRYKANTASVCLKKKCILFLFLPFLTRQVAANRTQVIQRPPGQEMLLLCKVFQVLMVDAEISTR
jgi:hypothetical protein